MNIKYGVIIICFFAMIINLRAQEAEKKSVIFNGHSINVLVYENSNKPVIMLLHGFPDNTHLYDRLVPELRKDFEIISFDFLGWGESDKPKDYNYTSINQKMELDAVITQMEIENPIIVAHDASGPPAIDWAIENETKINKLVLLNTYYSEMDKLKAPEAIWLFSTPVIRSIAKFLGGGRRNFVFHAVYRWQVGIFFRDPEIREKFVPILNEQFKVKPSTQRAFFGLNKDLNKTFKRGTKNLPKLEKFQKEVLIIFGEDDKYLNVNVAKEFDEIFSNSKLHLIQTARHFVQMDEPEKVANIIIDSIK